MQLNSVNVAGLALMALGLAMNFIFKRKTALRLVGVGIVMLGALIAVGCIG